MRFRPQARGGIENIGDVPHTCLPRETCGSRSLSGVCGFVFVEGDPNVFVRRIEASFRKRVVSLCGLDPNVSVRRIETSSLVSDVLAVPSLGVYLFSWSVSCVSYVYCGVVVIRCYVFGFRQLVLWQSSFSLVVRGFAQTQCLSSSCTVKAYFTTLWLCTRAVFLPCRQARNVRHHGGYGPGGWV